MTTTTTYNVYQRSGNRWVNVGSYQAPADEIQRREGLISFLIANGIQDTRSRKYTSRRA